MHASAFSTEHIRHSYCQAEGPRARTLKAREEGLLLSAISASLADSSQPACAAAPAAAAPAAAAALPACSAAALLRGALFDRDASTHVAAVVKRGKLLAVGTNRTGGGRSRGSGFSDFSLHAERAAVKALGDMSQLRGADMYVVRIPHAGHRREGQCSDLLYSRPCHECTVFLEKCMRVWGLRRVLYTTDMAMALSPPQCLKGWEDTARGPPAEDATARRRWERKVKVQRRLDAIRVHLSLEAAAAAAAAAAH